jgi:hypothetical protein
MGPFGMDKKRAHYRDRRCGGRPQRVMIVSHPARLKVLDVATNALDRELGPTYST